MLIGYNNDVEYRGKEFHIQTEDHGTGTAKIESQLFHAGQILDTKFVDYDDVLDEAPEEKHQALIEDRMRSVHVGLYQKLMEGEYDEMVGLDPVDDPEEVEAPDPDEFQPAQERVPAAAAKVEEGGQDALEDFHAQEANKHSDLESLKEKLGDEGSEAEEGDDLSDPDISLGDSAASDVATGATTTGETTTGGSESDGTSSDGTDEPADSNESTGGSEETSDPAASLREQIASAGRAREERRVRTDELELPDTGASAWSGCDEPDDELAIDELVEAQLDG